MTDLNPMLQSHFLEDADTPWPAPEHRTSFGADPHLTPARTFFGRRKGRPLSQRQKDALGAIERFSLAPWLENWPAHTWLEVGFGGAEHLLAWLNQHPGRHLIGVEVFENGLAKAAAELTLRQERRCVLFPQPVAHLWPHIPAQSLEGITIFFPDPWPKKRHISRRLLQNTFLDTCWRVLENHGVIHFASDHPDMIAHALEVFQSHPGFQGVRGVLAPESAQEDWPAWPQDWPSTRYHQKALAKGLSVAWSVWRKI